ncbi:hypothetical protein ALC56_05565 [Trachymyrmex septentrionalis]|uniref:Uncharacterized protein n=1 Tax=Trachymyrmex septentrionalis TaxID=34720 RepID=A0A151JXN3_9HYME|nr:hypothetical protein ALC56_05565 [Trachymyrmex septentrionalis]
MDAFKQQMLEGEKRLKEQSEAMTLQQQELERERRRLEETKNSNVDLTSLTSVLNSIQKDLSTLKTFNQRFQDLEKRMNDSITGDSITFTNMTDIIPIQFARTCKRVKELAPLINENHLVRILRNKLTGHAYLAIEDEIRDTIDQLIDLKRNFGPGRNSNYLKDISIIEGNQTQFGRKLNSYEIEQIDTLESFFEGLPPEYRAEMRMEEYLILSDVCNSKAILINKKLKRDRACQREIKINLTRTNSSTTAEKEAPQVSIMQPDRQPSINKPLLQVKICAYCTNFGHLISECRKRQYNNNAREIQQGNSLLAVLEIEVRPIVCTNESSIPHGEYNCR